MNNVNNININIQMLNIILKKLNDRKKCRNINKKLFNVDKILNINTKQCKYVGGENNIEIKTHLEIKFTSPDENGIICISILLDQYNDLVCEQTIMFPTYKIYKNYKNLISIYCKLSINDSKFKSIISV